MKNLRVILPSLALAALTATGCFLISGQFLVSIDLNSPLHVNSVSSVAGLYVDLTTDSDYNDHRKDIKDLSDLALLGQVHNTGSAALTLEVWLEEGNPGPQLPGAIRASGTQVWGPLTVAAGGTEDLTWNRSAGLFGAGKAPLLAQIKGGGRFTLYAIGSTSPFTFDFTNGVFVAVLSAGK